MAKSKKNFKPQGNLYDKIFKENAESIFIPLVEERLGVKIKQFTPFREKMQTTIEREMDFFYEVLTDSNETFILHLEFQTEDDPDMLVRAQEYHGMAYRRKQMEIRHVVVYLGTTEPKMQTQLEDKFVFRGFELLKIHDLDTQTLLSSQVPQVVLLAILANYPKEQAETVLRLLVKQLRALSKNKSELSRYLKQLAILARLRKLESLTVKISEEMPIVYDIETDYLYLQGMEKGFDKGQLLFVRNLLANTDFADDKIALLVGTTVAFVQQVRKSTLSPVSNATAKPKPKRIVQKRVVKPKDSKP
jgi:hypothetical protein